jgi:hypothetical protein
MIYIHYRNGVRLEGILMAMADGVARVAVKGADDAAVYRWVHGAWVSEDCEVVSFEFIEDCPRATDDVLERMFPAQPLQPATQHVM